MESGWSAQPMGVRCALSTATGGSDLGARPGSGPRLVLRQARPRL